MKTDLFSDLSTKLFVIIQEYSGNMYNIFALISESVLSIYHKIPLLRPPGFKHPPQI